MRRRIAARAAREPYRGGESRAAMERGPYRRRNQERRTRAAIEEARGKANKVANGAAPATKGANQNETSTGRARPAATGQPTILNFKLQTLN